MSEFKSILPFTSDEPAFALGVEVGMLYERMRQKESPIENTFHAANMDQFQLMCGHLGYQATEVEILADGWVYISFEKGS